VIIDKPIRSIDSFHPAIAKTIYLHFIGFNVFKPKNSSLTLLLSLAALALTVRTGAQVVTINQGFTGTTAPGWNLGGTGYTPVLTAAQGIDPSGSGWLRLTSNGGNQATYAYDTTSFNAANSTIAVKFNYATYNGSGADGLTFFLADASKTFSVGAYGGSLGYAQKTVAGGGGADINGMNGGYLGIGIDEFGNYSNPTEGRIGGVGSLPNAIAVRGPGQGLTGYNYLGGTGNLGANSIAFPSSTSRPTGANSRSVEMILTATNQLTIYMSSGGGAYLPLYSIDLSGYARPDQLVMGFTGSTGGSTDIHEIQNVSLSSVAANLWTNAAGTSTWGTTGANWNGMVAPVTGADILLDNTYVSSAQTIDGGAGQTRLVRSLQIDAPFSYTLNNGTLEFNNNGILGPSGILVSQTHGSAAQTVNSNLVADNAIEIKNGSAGALNLTGTLALSGNTVTVDGTGNTTLSGVVSGTGSLVKNDSGTVTLSGANTYTGGTAINSGTLQLGASNVLADTGSVSIGATGTLNLNGFSEKVGTLTAAGGASLDFGSPTAGNTFVFGSYTAPTSGVLVVNNWQQGTDTLASTVAGQNVSTVYLSGYGIAQEAAATSSTLYGNAYLLTQLAQTGIVWNGSSNNNWSNVNSWTGGAIPTAAQVAIFDSTGAGHTGVNLNNSYTVAGLKFDTSAPSYTIAGANTLTLAGTLPYIQQKSGNNQTLSFTTLALGNNTVADITGAGNLTISSAITGAYSLTRDGSGTGKLVLNGANTFSGGLFINSGVVQAGNTGALGTGTTTISGGAALELSGGISPTNALSVGGQGVGGAGAIRNVAGNNTLSGTVTLAADSRINADAGTLNLSNNVTSTTNANLTLGGAGTINVTGPISTGGGGITKDGAGTVTFSGANTNSGATNITAGTLALGASNVLANTTAVSVASGANFNLNGNSDTVGSVAGAGNVILGAGALAAGSNNTSTTFSGVISGTGALTKSGTGTLTLSGNNTYTGGTNINAGTLQLGGSERIANNAAVTIASGATLNLNTYTETIGALSGAGKVQLTTGTLVVGSGNASSTFSGSFAAGDKGTFELTGTSPTSNTLTFGSGMNLSSGTLVLNGGTLNLGGFSSTFGALSVTANSIIDFGTGSASILNLNSLTITAGVTLTIANWTDTIDYFYSLLSPGAPNLGQIAFTGYSASGTKWQSFDHQITPVPEPSTYGAAFMLLGLALGAWRCFRRRNDVSAH
jgi:autotransporter-associated beta strand protein